MNPEGEFPLSTIAVDMCLMREARAELSNQHMFEKYICLQALLGNVIKEQSLHRVL